MKKRAIGALVFLGAALLAIVGIVVWKKFSRPNLPPITLQLNRECVKKVKANVSFGPENREVERTDSAEVEHWVQEMNKLNFKYVMELEKSIKQHTEYNGNFSETILFCDSQDNCIKVLVWKDQTSRVRYVENEHIYECELIAESEAYRLITELLDEWWEKKASSKY